MTATRVPPMFRFLSRHLLKRMSSRIKASAISAAIEPTFDEEFSHSIWAGSSVIRK